VTITVPEVLVEKVENISKFIGNEDEVVTAVLLKVLGDAPGVMIFLFPKGSDGDIIKLLTNKPRKNTKKLDDFEQSALKEVGNILSGASLTAFAKFLNINVIHSVSEIVTDILGAVINSLMAEIGRNSSVALISRVDLMVPEDNIKTSLYFFIDPQSTSKILELTGKKIS